MCLYSYVPKMANLFLKKIIYRRTFEKTNYNSGFFYYFKAFMMSKQIFLLYLMGCITS